MIEVKNITHQYGKLKTLDDVSIVFKDQKITGVIGANGAGKSTLLGIVSRLIKPFSGTVEVDGMSVDGMKGQDLAKRIAILKQSNQVNIKITVRELVSLGRFPHSKGRLTTNDITMIDEALNYLALEELQHRYLDELSGGQKQRVFLAMILAQDTQYILLDEPLNNLDLRYGIEMMSLLRRIVKDYGKTVILVLHDINFAGAFCDELVAMKNGAIIKVGDANAVIVKSVLDEVYNHNFKVCCLDNQQVVLYENSDE